MRHMLQITIFGVWWLYVSGCKISIPPRLVNLLDSRALRSDGHRLSKLGIVGHRPLLHRALFNLHFISG